MRLLRDQKVGNIFRVELDIHTAQGLVRRVCRTSKARL